MKRTVHILALLSALAFGACSEEKSGPGPTSHKPRESHEDRAKQDAIKADCVKTCVPLESKDPAAADACTQKAWDALKELTPHKKYPMGVAGCPG